MSDIRTVKRRRTWRLVGVLVIVITAAVSYLSLLADWAPIQAGMNEHEVGVALGSGFVVNDTESGGGERWAQECDIVYVDDPNWLGCRRKYIVHYDETRKVQSWKRGECPLERPSWLNGLLHPIGL